MKTSAFITVTALVLLGGCQSAMLQTAATPGTNPLQSPGSQAPATALASPPGAQAPANPPAANAASAAASSQASLIPATAPNQPSTVPEIRPVSATFPVATPPAAVPVGAAAPAQQQFFAPGAEKVLPGDLLTPQRLSLVDAINTSLAQNPDLVVLRTAEGVGQGAMGVARTYPFNPYVQIQALPYRKFPDGARGYQYDYIVLMQTLQLGHQQRFRNEGAMAALQSVQWNIHQAELLNLAQTERLYFTALYQRSIRDLVQANASLSDELQRVLECQLQAGQASAADLAIVQLDNQSTRIQAQLAEANFQTALLDLRRQLNLPSSARLELADDLAAWQWLLPSGPNPSTPNPPARNVVGQSGTANPEDMISQYAAARPDVMAARMDVATAQASLGVADGSRRPDLQIGPMLARNEDGVVMAGLRAQSDLPVFNSGKPLVRQRQAEVTQRVATWQQLQGRAELEARNAFQRYQRALRIVGQPGGNPQGPLFADLNKLEEQLRAGEVDFLRVFTTRTSLLQLRRAQLDALNELAQAAANLTAVTGIPPDALIAGRAASATPGP